jgi:hypothetical protein
MTGRASNRRHAMRHVKKKLAGYVDFDRQPFD